MYKLERNFMINVVLHALEGSMLSGVVVYIVVFLMNIWEPKPPGHILFSLYGAVKQSSNTSSFV